MVIAHVIDSLEMGGAEAIVATLCRLHSQENHSVSVHCLLKGGAIAERLRADGVPVFVYGPARVGYRLYRLYRAFRQIRPDVVHCHNKSATVHAAALARVTGARAVVSTRHGLAAPPYRLRKDFKFWLVAAVFCDRIVAVCETARFNMVSGAKRLSHNVMTIRNGADALERVASPAGNLRPTGGLKLISVGRLVPAKDYETLLRSIALAQRSVPDLSLRIVGGGPGAAALQRLVDELGLGERVQLCGERHDVGVWLHDADIFVMSSVSEGLPISIIEALAAGLPVIATAVGGIPEVIDLCGVGKTVAPGDIQQLAAAIVDFAERRESMPAWRLRARACYERFFTSERMACEYLSLYRACVSAADVR